MTCKGRGGGSPGSNEPQSWPFSGRFCPVRLPQPSKRGQGRARSRCLFAVLSQEWLFHAPHRLCFQRHPGHVRMLQLPRPRRPMRQLVRRLRRLEAGIFRRSARQGRQRRDHPGADGDELRAGDHQCRSRPAQFQSLARSVSRQARGHDHRREGAAAQGVAGRAVRFHSGALRRAAGAAAGDLGDGDRVRQPARQPEHARLDRDAGL